MSKVKQWGIDSPKVGVTYKFNEVVPKTSFPQKPNGKVQKEEVRLFSQGKVVKFLQGGNVVMVAPENIENKQCKNCYKLSKKEYFFIY